MSPDQDRRHGRRLTHVNVIRRAELNEVTAVFRSIADGETRHAYGYLKFLAPTGDPATGEPIGTTEQNLKAALARDLMRSPTGSRL